jgi:hypothetical protein
LFSPCVDGENDSEHFEERHGNALFSLREGDLVVCPPMKEVVSVAVWREQPGAHACVARIGEEREPLREGDKCQGERNEIHSVPLAQTFIPPSEFH